MSSVSDNESDIIKIVDEKFEEPKKITKTDALQKYLLREKDLLGLNPEVKSVKKYGRIIIMRLYLEDDVLARSINRWGSEDNLQREKEKRQKSKKERFEQKQNAIKIIRDKRYLELSSALEKVGLQFRNDSKLCNGYINGSLESNWTMAEIVEMCELMNWLHTCTDYQKRLDAFFASYKRKREIRYADYHIHDNQQEEKEYIESQIEIIREKIIKEHGGGTPWKN